MYRTIAKKVFWELNSIIMQNLSDVLPLFCTPTWPSHHVSENQELVPLVYLEFSRFLFCFLFFFQEHNGWFGARGDTSGYEDVAVISQWSSGRAQDRSRNITGAHA